jgi:hypothetical protein
MKVATARTFSGALWKVRHAGPTSDEALIMLSDWNETNAAPRWFKNGNIRLVLRLSRGRSNNLLFVSASRQRIDGQVPLATGNFLGCIVALGFSSLGRADLWARALVFESKAPPCAIVR